MREVKKVIALALALAMVMVMTMVAFAAEDPSHEVTGSYGGASGTPVYSYTYRFGDMQFRYNDAAEGTWDPQTHTFKGEATEGGWVAVGTSNEITVWNHSNSEIVVTPVFEPAMEGIEFGFTSTKITLPSAVGTTPDEAPSETFECGPTDECIGLSAGQNNVKLGTITLKVKAA